MSRTFDDHETEVLRALLAAIRRYERDTALIEWVRLHDLAATVAEYLK